LDSGFISLDPMGKAFKLGKLALMNLGQPGIQTLTKGSQMFLFDLLSFVWAAHEQRDSRC